MGYAESVEGETAIAPFWQLPESPSQWIREWTKEWTALAPRFSASGSAVQVGFFRLSTHTVLLTDSESSNSIGSIHIAILARAKFSSDSFPSHTTCSWCIPVLDNSCFPVSPHCQPRREVGLRAVPSSLVSRTQRWLSGWLKSAMVNFPNHSYEPYPENCFLTID